MNRIGAFLIHLGISLVIFGVLAAIVVYVWYPGFFFGTDGGWQGIRIIVLVDLVLGPLLTLVVFNRKKPRFELTRDLTLIGMFQSICLIAGTYVVYMERPLALVYLDGQFFSMSADDYQEAGMAVPDFRDIPGPYPKKVAVDLPEDYAAQSRIRRQALEERKPLRAYADLYRPLSNERLHAAREAFNNQALIEKNEDRVADWLAAHGGSLDDYAFFPYGARYGYTFLGVSKDSGEILGTLGIPRLQKRSEEDPGVPEGG